jgi:hypothetical protein
VESQQDRKRERERERRRRRRRSVGGKGIERGPGIHEVSETG